MCLCLNAGRQTSWWLFCPREINSGASVLLLSVSGIWNRNIIISLHLFSLFLSEKKAAKRNKKWPRGCLPANKARDTFEPPHSSSFSLSALYYFFFRYFLLLAFLFTQNCCWPFYLVAFGLLRWWRDPSGSVGVRTGSKFTLGPPLWAWQMSAVVDASPGSGRIRNRSIVSITLLPLKRKIANFERLWLWNLLAGSCFALVFFFDWNGLCEAASLKLRKKKKKKLGSENGWIYIFCWGCSSSPSSDVLLERGAISFNEG